MQRPFSQNSAAAKPTTKPPSNARKTKDAESRCHPVSYSGTQVNIFGPQNPDQLQQLMDQPLGLPNQQGGIYPYSSVYPPYGYTSNTQLGLVTEHMLRRLDESRLMTMTELMRKTQGYGSGPFVQEPLSPKQPQLEFRPAKPLNENSPGQGDWKGQIEHIYTHLMEVALDDKQFRTSIGEPRFGEILAADLEDSGEAYVLTLTFGKPKGNAERRSFPTETLERRASKPKANLNKVVSKVKKQIEQEEPQYEKENIKQEGTLKPYRQFNPEADAEVLRKAMKGLGTDEEAITQVFGKRSNKQRQEIIKMYKTMFGKDLLKELKSELSGEYWKVIRALCMHPADFDAMELRAAIKGFGTDDSTLIEIICTRINKSLQLIKDSYKKLYNRSLEEDIAGDTSGHYKRLLISLLQANRDESNVADIGQARKDAQLLYEAGARKWGTDESRFNAILVARSYAQLRATFREYERVGGKTVQEAIRSEMSGELASGMLTIVQCVEDKAAYFANQLYRSMKGLGTDDSTLIRIVVSRCEVDMVQVKEEFQLHHKQSLAQYISDDTSGDYRKILLLLVGSSNLANRAESEDEDSEY